MRNEQEQAAYVANLREHIEREYGGCHTAVPRTLRERYAAWGDSGRLGAALESLNDTAGLYRRLEQVRCSCGEVFAPEGDRTEAHKYHAKPQPAARTGWQSVDLGLVYHGRSDGTVYSTVERKY